MLAWSKMSEPAAAPGEVGATMVTRSAMPSPSMSLPAPGIAAEAILAAGVGPAGAVVAVVAAAVVVGIDEDGSDDVGEVSGVEAGVVTTRGAPGMIC
jgi:hypothetical protein